MNEALARRLFRAVAEGTLLAALTLGGCGPLVPADEPDAGTVADAGGAGGGGFSGVGAGVGGGRPLLVDDAVLIAAVVQRSDWA